jgi:hypothetical protein
MVGPGFVRETSVSSVVKDFFELTTEGTELHKGKSTGCGVCPHALLRQPAPPIPAINIIGREMQ